ncbi:MAG: putative metal-binding motif-containing protein [Myxococcota bacterium]
MRLQAFASALALLSLSCGARSEIALEQRGAGGSGGSGAGGSPAVDCRVDGDCAVANACGSYRCVADRCVFEAVSCDDGDPCTEDTCEMDSGCRHRFLSLDLDGDGHRSPRPGFSSQTDVCGDDCDDSNPNAFKMNREVCDGVDNDCNGVVDDGYTYQRSALMPVRVSPASARRSQRDDGGIVATTNAFVVAYTSLEDRYESRIQGLSPNGARLFQTQVSDVNLNTFAGPLAWSGQDLATAWSDARQAGGYELYARLFGPGGEKQMLATRITDAAGFSLHPSIKWNQSEYLVAFDDRRSNSVLGDRPQIFAQRLAPDGSLLGGNVLLAGEDATSEFPSLALSSRRVGLAFTLTQLGDPHSRLGFRVFDATLSPVGTKPAPIGSDVDTISIQFVGDRFITLWDVSDGTMQGDAIWGAAFDETGKLLIAPRRVTSSARFARSVSGLSLGDRLLMMWADDAETASGVYELYYQVLDLNLNVVQSRQRFTFSNTTSLLPGLTPGPGGKIGIAFESWQDGSRQVYFSTLECAIPL